MRRSLTLIGLAILAALALAAFIVTVRARRVEAETRRLIADSPSPAAAQAEARATADAFADPRLAATLAELAAHLPSATPVAGAARGRDGALRIALDTADPDELRPLIAADSWFDRFHERAQEQRAEGRIRVTLVEDGR